MSSPKEQNDKDETIAERSARLEAEAEALAQRDAYMSDDPLMPTALEDEEDSNIDAVTEIGLQADEGISKQAEGIIKALQDEADQAKDHAQRALAEAENTRKRAQKDRADASKFAVTAFAKDLLEVSDNLRRALEAIPAELLEAQPEVKNLVDGIEATERALLRSFEKQGIKKVDPLDEPFDPNFHEVMFEAPVPGKPAGVVMQVMEPGYVIHDRLLRPARVGVSKADGSAPPAAGGDVDIEA